MAFNEGLAERVRSVLDGEADVTEKKMFGGLCFLLGGKMCCGITGEELMARVSRQGYAAALVRPHARPMDFTGTPLKGFIFVAPEGIDFDADLEAWVLEGVAVARALLAAKRKPKTVRSKPPAPSKAPVKRHPRAVRARRRRGSD